ncbi:MAG TPA: hypothetical protein EYP68_03255 [Candidatus Korarchaeota archaeon]|nr:hypothetical protein [Candidatus Korarchaeota archaeon]
MFEDIAERKGLEFRCDKRDGSYVELGGGNKFMTFKLWFSSASGLKTLVKVQVNFVEYIIFPIKEVKLKSICPESEELEFLFPEFYMEYRKSIRFKVYDIFCEKARAILTRKGFKERDFVDAYMISKRFNLRYEDLEEETLRKLKFILRLYYKYRRNLNDKVSMLTVENFPFGSERYLLMEKIDEEDFHLFLNGFMVWLKELAKADSFRVNRTLKG